MMMTLIAAALAAAVQPAAAAQPADAHAQHQQGQHSGQHSDHQGMKCCEHMKAGHKMDCCKDMADAAKAKGCCAEHGKTGQGEHKHH